MRRALAILLALGGGAVQAQQPRTIARFSLRLADLSLAADTISGLTVIVEPAVTSKEGKAGQGLIWLRFHPDSAFEWINNAAAVLRAPVPGGPADGIQWSRTLSAETGNGGALALGRQRKKGALQKTHWLAVGDSSFGWRIEVSGVQADSLLHAILALASQSRIDTGATAPLPSDRVDVPITPIEQPAPRYRGRSGRVLAQYVIGTDGRVEPESLVVFAASDAALIEDALEAVRAARYRPAQRAGRPVRQLVERVISWPAR